MNEADMNKDSKPGMLRSTVKNGGKRNGSAPFGLRSVNVWVSGTTLASAGGRIGHWIKRASNQERTNRILDFEDDENGKNNWAKRELSLTPLVQNPFYRELADKIPLTATAETLPDIHGSGAVRDLREAANDLDWRMAG